MIALPQRSTATDPMIDSFGRRITYVRLSVTDRCDLRCRYCMAEDMQFLPKQEILSFDEIAALTDVLIARGVKRIRLTGGEPLVRRDISDLCARLGKRLDHGLDELTMTTNGTQLARFAPALRAAGIRRINVSLDSRDAARFRQITRRGDLAQVLGGIEAAAAAGLAIKINMVALKGVNDDEIEDMLRWCAGQGHTLTLIETMPLGDVEADRAEHYLPLDEVRRTLERRLTLVPSPHRTGGPARYFDVPELGTTLGLITPLTNNFCDGCNRIRITATGTVFGCLGQDQKVELRTLLRTGGPAAVHGALDELLAGKPRGHDFRIAAPRPAIARHMNVTGG
ncbi:MULTISPECIES: GTP 3',8-cyclase MoaA [Sphingomonas]|uniref:GTP 3',8-cyclase MoaA n=1 Tax=Sphingomonas TaxID=13687 RepID=UPI001F07E368|nr:MULTISPECIES: GTP 3',8-cyclase MoaA [Sphingomonas]